MTSPVLFHSPQSKYPRSLEEAVAMKLDPHFYSPTPKIEVRHRCRRRTCSQGEPAPNTPLSHSRCADNLTPLQCTSATCAAATFISTPTKSTSPCSWFHAASTTSTTSTSDSWLQSLIPDNFGAMTPAAKCDNFQCSMELEDGVDIDVVSEHAVKDPWEGKSMGTAQSFVPSVIETS